MDFYYFRAVFSSQQKCVESTRFAYKLRPTHDIIFEMPHQCCVSRLVFGDWVERIQEDDFFVENYLVSTSQHNETHPHRKSREKGISGMIQRADMAFIELEGKW